MGTRFFSSLRYILLYSTVAALFGCERYAVTLNQQPVYIPPPLYSDFKVADKALMNCLKQTIADRKVVRTEQLTSLTCRHAGVASLEGLDHFAFLQELDLSHNQLVDAQSLGLLTQLKVLRIQENAKLKCETLTSLPQSGLKVTAPDHCADL